VIRALEKDLKRTKKRALANICTARSEAKVESDLDRELYEKERQSFNKRMTNLSEEHLRVRRRLVRTESEIQKAVSDREDLQNELEAARQQQVAAERKNDELSVQVTACREAEKAAYSALSKIRQRDSRHVVVGGESGVFERSGTKSRRSGGGGGGSVSMRMDMGAEIEHQQQVMIRSLRIQVSCCCLFFVFSHFVTILIVSLLQNSSNIKCSSFFLFLLFLFFFFFCPLMITAGNVRERID